MTRAYLDHNATAPLRPAAAAAMREAMEAGGNPSSVHSAGRIARRLVEDARASVAALAGCPPAAVVFTSGGTEANWQAIAGAAAGGDVARILVTAVEHPCVLEAARTAGLPCAEVPVDANGAVDLDALDRALAADAAPALVCVMAANNETGVVQPIGEVARLCRSHAARLHVDAAQLPGRHPLDALDGVSSFALSAHKFGGPQGTGALILNEPFGWSAVLVGGGQEGRRRGGTQNVPGIAGFGAAAAEAAAAGDLQPDLRDEAERRALSISEALGIHATVAGARAPRLPNTSCVGFSGVRAETLVMALDLAGVCVSAGSACSSGKVSASHVLKAMGWSDADAGSAIRLSFGWDSREEDIDRLSAALETALARMAPARTTLRTVSGGTNE